MRIVTVETKLFKNTLIGGKATKEGVLDYIKGKEVKSSDLKKVFITSKYEDLYLDITECIFKELNKKEKKELKKDLISLNNSKNLNENISGLYNKYGELFEDYLKELASEKFCNYMYADGLIYCIELH